MKIKATNYFNYMDNLRIQILMYSYSVNFFSLIMLATKICWIEIVINEIFLIYGNYFVKLLYCNCIVVPVKLIVK